MSQREARFAGRCANCGGSFPAGALIDWTPERTVHVQCELVPDQAPQPAVLITDEQRQEAEQFLVGITNPNEFKASLQAYLERNGKLTDNQVRAVLKDIARVRKPQRDEKPSVTEPGVYETPEGVIYVVKWNKDKDGLYAKKIRELNSTRITEAGTVVKIEFDYESGAVFRLRPEMKMPLERAKFFTLRYGKCIVCGRKLKTKESVERGIGPVCILSFG